MIRQEIERNLKKISHEEKRYISQRLKKKETAVAKVVAEKIPEKLENTLNAAFSKAFETVFQEGTKILDKTLDKNGKKKFSNAFETAFTVVEGAGMGAAGVGIPDIPIYTAVVLRSIYMTAKDRGFDFESKTEKVYILRLIAAALSDSENIERLNRELDEYSDSIDKDNAVYYGLFDCDIDAAGKALSEEMLYMKFIQGIPVVGAAGGISNAVTLKKIRQFAEIKYEKRELKKML